TPRARELSRFVLRPHLDAIVPALAWLPPILYSWVQWPALGLLPAGLRAEYGIPWGPGHAAVAAWLKTGMLFGVRNAPGRLAWFPQARRAYDRADAATTEDQ